MRTAWRVLNVVGLVFIAAAAAPPEKPVVESPVVQVKDLTPVALVRRFLGCGLPIVTLISRGVYANLQGIQEKTLPWSRKCPARTSSRKSRSPKAGAPTSNPLS